MGFPAELRRTAIDDVALLSPGEETRLPMEIVLTGAAGKTFRLDVRSDKGAYTGQLAPEPWELLSPASMSAADFEGYRRRFSGLGEDSKTFPLAALGLLAGASVAAVEQEVAARFRRLFNLYTVQGAGCGEMLFAGSKKEMVKEERVLLSVLSTRYAALFACAVAPSLSFSS